MGAGGLNYRVRNGNGCGPTAIATGKNFRVSAPPRESQLQIKLDSECKDELEASRCVLELERVLDVS